jgi:hypothetical protein
MDDTACASVSTGAIEGEIEVGGESPIPVAVAPISTILSANVATGTLPE